MAEVIAKSKEHKVQLSWNRIVYSSDTFDSMLDNYNENKMKALVTRSITISILFEASSFRNPNQTLLSSLCLPMHLSQ